MSTSTASKRRPGEAGSNPGGAPTIEEIALHQAGTRIGRERRGFGQQPELVPLENLAERFDHDQGPHPRFVEYGARRVAEPESADDDVEAGAGDTREPKASQLHLGHGEEAGHQELVTQLHFVDVDAQRGLAPSPQAHRSHGGFVPGEFLEPRGHV